MSYDNNLSKKVVIIGAGIGGLTAAHFLVGNVKEIHIYEKNSVAGGLARTETPLGSSSSCDTREISWRVYFHFYYHIFEIMKQIPSFDDKTVYDHLVIYRNVFTPEIDPLHFLSLAQLFKIVKTLFSSNLRIDHYDNQSWRDFIGDDNSEIPQWLGMDRFKGSTTSVQRIGIEQHLRKTEGVEDYVLDGPTSQVWIDPWVKYLQDKGVIFHFSQPITKITVNDKGDAIKEIVIGESVVNADLYILGLPIEVLARILPTLVPEGYRLSERSKQIQIGFQIHLDTKISFGHDRDGKPFQSFLVRNSPWALIVESKTISWTEADHINKEKLHPKTTFKCPTTQWSITACQIDVPGIKIRKSLSLCSEQEMREEILAQLYDNKNLMDRLRRENPSVEDIKSVIDSGKWSYPSTEDFGIMSSFAVTPEGLKTSEPKFSNNVGTKSIRPPSKIGKNTYISTAYIKETIDVFSMEAAAIAGKTVAHNILSQDIAKPSLPPRPYPILEGFRSVDSLLFKIGVPDVFTIICIFLVFLLVWLVWRKFINTSS